MAVANVKINAISWNGEREATRGRKKKNIVCRENWGAHPEGGR